MDSTPSTFATLCALHSIVGEALDDIQHVFSQPQLINTPSSPSPSFSNTSSASFPPASLASELSIRTGPPHSTSGVGGPIVDYPSPDKPIIATSLGEQLAAHPDAAAAAMRVVAACGQISNIVHKPFLTLSDALLSFNLPACLRLVGHLHVVEILREAEDERERLAQGKGESSHVPAQTSLSGMKEEPGKREETGEVPLPEGMHVIDITRVICAHAGKKLVDPSKLAHALRLLVVHHLLRETAPDTFALTRVLSLLDTGKSVKEVFSSPETKYANTNGIAAYAAICTEDNFKSAAYLTEAFTGVQLPNLSAATFCTNPTEHDTSVCSVVPLSLPHTKGVKDTSLPSGECNYRQAGTSEAFAEHDSLPAFNLAFHTNVPFYEWLETRGKDLLGGTGVGAGHTSNELHSRDTMMRTSEVTGYRRSKPFRLERFSRAMIGTSEWEAPEAILRSFDWESLPNGSTIIDVGGGIGSATMVLARAFASGSMTKHDDNIENKGLRQLDDKCVPRDALNFRFIVQDRPVVVGLGLATWRSRCPEMLESGRVVFQEHDFFEPQPLLSSPHLNDYPAVYLLRIVLHNWPDEFARRILVNLRHASGPETQLLIADYVVPLGCIDECMQKDHRGNELCQKSEKDEWTLDAVLAHVEGAERVLALPPLLPNLGKANASVYWMDLIMHILFNGKERTLRELCALALSAGWRVRRMTRLGSSMFGYLVCVPIPLPEDVQVTEATTSTTSGLADVANVSL